MDIAFNMDNPEGILNVFIYSLKYLQCLCFEMLETDISTHVYGRKIVHHYISVTAVVFDSSSIKFLMKALKLLYFLPAGFFVLFCFFKPFDH